MIKVLNELNRNKILASINFAGYFNQKVKDKIIFTAKKYQIEKQIKFQGPYQQNKADLIYNSADIYFYFVHQSNCPNSVIEAMSCGLPVLCSSTGGLPEIVNKDSGICLTSETNWDEPSLPKIDDAINGVQEIVKNYGDILIIVLIKLLKIIISIIGLTNIKKHLESLYENISHWLCRLYWISCFK